MDQTYTPPRYPVVQFLVRNGMRIALVAGIAFGVLGALLTVGGAGWIWLPAGIVLGVATGVLLASYVEVLRIIADTLIPR
jgi:hypothetical protein